MNYFTDVPQLESDWSEVDHLFTLFRHGKRDGTTECVEDSARITEIK